MKRFLYISTAPLRFVRRRWKLSLLLLVLGLGIGFWRYQAVQAAKPKLVFEHPQYRDIARTLNVTGVVDAKEKASLRFAAGGKVVYIGAQEGDLVRKWQTIATIDQRELRKRLEQDLNTSWQMRLDREENVDVLSEKSFPGYQLRGELREADKQQQDLENSVLDVEIRTIAIQNTVLSAPINGILVSSPTNVSGVTLLATDAFEIINPETLIFRAAVDEADIGLVQLGQLGDISLDAYPEEPLSSAVSYIDVKSSQTSSGTVFVVELPLTHDPELRKYKLGMNGDVEIVIDKRDQVLTVPLEATRERDNHFYVDVRTGANTYEERQIEVGLETDEYVEVLTGLSENDEVLMPETE